MRNPLGRPIPLKGGRVLLASGLVVTRQEREREHQRRRRAYWSSRSEGQVVRDRAAMHPGGLKRCQRCHRELPFHSFAPALSRKDGLNPRCYGCRAETAGAAHE